jgi:hypothetical protein
VLWTGFIWLRIETEKCSHEHDDGLSGSIKCLKILEELRDWRLLKEDLAS